MNTSSEKSIFKECQQRGETSSSRIDSELLPLETRALIAVDMGAQSCRVSLLRWVTGRPEIRVVHRFANEAVPRAQGLTWDIGRLLAEIEIGICMCAKIADEGVAAIGVDCWAVDYARLTKEGDLVSDPFCYRDERNIEAEKQVYAKIPAARLYALTGIQLLRFNTLFQLYADTIAGVPPETSWLNLPEYILYRLGAGRFSEFTNATHTQLVELGKQRWSKKIFDELGLDITAAPPIVLPGSIVGKLRSGFSQLPALRHTVLIAPACHDTASAIAAIPAIGDDWAFISSGTWSLVGTVLEEPCVSAEAMTKNYTNLGGVGGKICFLKNVNGMWLIGQCMEHWEKSGKPWRISELVAASENAVEADGLIDVDHPSLLLPDGMPARINELRTRAGLVPLSEDSDHAPEMANLIFRSLAARYAEVLKDIASMTGKMLKRVFVVGGGSRNDFLNRLTAEASGLNVLRGCVEGSTVGNFAIQLASLEGVANSPAGLAPAVAHWASVLGRAEVNAAETVDV